MRDSSGEASGAFALLSRVTAACPAVQRRLTTEYALGRPAQAARGRRGRGPPGGAPRDALPARAVLDSLALVALLGGFVAWHLCGRPVRAQTQRPWHRSIPAA